MVIKILLNAPFIFINMADEFGEWKRHFLNQARGLIPPQKTFYKVSEQRGKGGETNIKMVSPTQQIVDRAKSTLAQPPTVYDPVTGVVRETESIMEEHKPRKRKINRKKKTVNKNLPET